MYGVMGMLERIREPRAVAGVALPLFPSLFPLELGLVLGLVLSWMRRRNCSLFMVSVLG